ncbi:MAG: O-antigen ligase family protein [Patescibacteria group bacterium]|nr:O-antigen ligase family protein [Patescibacteria group bacterium]
MIDRSKLIKAFVFSGLIYALTGLFQFIGLTEIVTLDGRISGFLGSANYLAMYLLPLILLSASYWMYDFFITKARSTYMWNELVVVLAMIFVLGLTVSYNAFLALLFAGVYLIFRLRLVQAALVFVSIFIVFLVTQLGSEKLMQAFEFDDRSSSSVRTEVYEVTGQLISERPLTGYGLGSYESVYLQQAPRILEKAPMEWVMIHPHNTFLSFFYQLGIFGAVWFVILLLFYWAKLQKFVDRVDRRQAIALSSAFLGILFLSLFDTHFWKNDFAVQFFLLLWLIDSVRQKHTL